LNDLWQYDISTGYWTWVSGLTTSAASDGGQVYGILGVAAAGNTPAGHYSASTWKASDGSLWLYGLGYNDVTDLWKFDPTTFLWTWEGGQPNPDGTGITAVYGTQGVAAATNFPGVMQVAISWTDTSGHFWLYGGYGWPETGGYQGLLQLNDMWEYLP
jgi:hypothetical protein